MTVRNDELSKVVSHALRHEPWLYELELDDEGWASLDAVLTSSEISALPMLDVTSRVAQQTYAYDWRHNITQTDTTNAFFDRSLGTPTYSLDAPHQLTGATHPNGTLAAQYDATGNLVNLVVKRDGACLGPIAKCVQRFVYDWDEVGQLARARRWDYVTLPTTDPPYPQVPADQPAVDLSFKYHQNQRILKESVNASGPDTFTVNRLMQNGHLSDAA